MCLALRKASRAGNGRPISYVCARASRSSSPDRRIKRKPWRNNCIGRIELTVICCWTSISRLSMSATCQLPTRFSLCSSTACTHRPIPARNPDKKWLIDAENEYVRKGSCPLDRYVCVCVFFFIRSGRHRWCESCQFDRQSFDLNKYMRVTRQVSMCAFLHLKWFAICVSLAGCCSNNSTLSLGRRVSGHFAYIAKMSNWISPRLVFHPAGLLLLLLLIVCQTQCNVHNCWIYQCAQDDGA